MFQFRDTKWIRIINRGEVGVTLIETALATAILGMAFVGLLQGLSIAIKSDFVITKLSAAEGLAVSELEQIKTNSYIDYSVPGHAEYEIVATSADYFIEVGVTPLAIDTGQPIDLSLDQGLQRIAVAVRYNGELATELEGYKLNR